MATTQQSGFAPAASPLASTIVQTPDDAIVAGFTSIPSQGDNMPAYHARPKQSDGPLPVVIVVQEIFGVHEHIRDICRRLALEGYLAIAPELYFREGDPNDFADIPTLLSGLVAKVPDSQVLADLDHVASWASRNGGDVHRLMITGFCWGGRITWLYAAHNPQLKAAVAWYGKLTGDKSLNSPKQPVDIATDLNAPVLGLYGGQDNSIPQESVETMRQALRAANAKAEIIVYPDAGHASAMTCKLWWRRWRSAWASINQTFASWSTLIFRAISNPIIRTALAANCGVTEISNFRLPVTVT